MINTAFYTFRFRSLIVQENYLLAGIAVVSPTFQVDSPASPSRFTYGLKSIRPLTKEEKADIPADMKKPSDANAP